MDKRNKRNEATDKKTDKLKDRGDLKKANDKIIMKSDENTQVDMKLTFPDCGDSERKPTNQKPDKMRINIVVKKPTNEESKIKNNDIATEKEVVCKKNTDRDGQDKTQYVCELRKRIRDKYTLKLKNPIVDKDLNSNLNKKFKDYGKVSAVKSDGRNVDRLKKQLAEETTQTIDKINPWPNSFTKTDPKLDRKPEKPQGNLATTDRVAKPEGNAERRKPIIRTIMSENGSMKIYKAVTFDEQKRTDRPTPLEINIPGHVMKQQKASKFTDTNSLKFKTKVTVSRASIKDKPVTVRRKLERKQAKKNRHTTSPDCSTLDNKSPPTEVARWAPSCINRHTKPYYEAWVDTTLAAISNGSKKDKLFYEKQRKTIMRGIQRALQERQRSPELFYENLADERYTGRIKITQR